MRIKILFIAAAVLAAQVVSLAAEKPDFSAGFAKGLGPDNNPLSAFSPAARNVCFTKDGEGLSGKGVLVARDSMQDFAVIVDSVPKIAAPPTYSDIACLNPEEGTFEAWIKPWFNQTEKTPGGANVYYIFDIWSYTREDRKASEEAAKLFPGGIQMLIYVPPSGVKTIEASCMLADGVRVNIKSTPVQMEAQKWYHVALAWDKTSFSAFLDGKKVATKAINGPLKDFKPPFALGASLSYTCHMQGVMDNVKVYRKAVYGADFTPAK